MGACWSGIALAATYGELYALAVDAYQQNDFDAFGAVVDDMLELRPDYPDALYFKGIFQASTGKSELALATLQRLAAMGLDYPAEDDDDFQQLRGNEGFLTVTRRFRRNRVALGEATIALTLSDKDFLLEGIAYSPDYQAFFLGSVRKGEIYRVTTAGLAQRFISLRQHGLWSAFALDIDKANDLLVVGTNNVAQFMSADTDSPGGSALAWFSLTKGELVFRCDFEGPANEQHVLGDLRVHPASGHVFVSDSVGGGVYRVSPETCEFHSIVEPGQFVSPQGIAFAGSDNIAYMADYRGGLFAWDEDNATLTKVTAPDDTTLYGIDGLISHAGCLVAVQNGIRPHRVIRLCLTDRTTISHGEVLASSLPEFDEPTQVTVAGGELYLVANSQWNKYGEDGSPIDPGALQPPVVLRVSARPQSQSDD